MLKQLFEGGLGFLSKPLYLFANFFQDKPVEKLLGDGLTSELINDDKIGRVMDKIHEISIESLWTNIGINTLDKFHLNTQFSHLDSTSISLEGKYENYSEENRENIININHGYSRDKRPELKQFMLDLMVTNDGDVPIFMRVGDGNESDKKIFTSFINDFQKNIKINTTYVADSALYTSNNLQKMKDLSGITRVPMTIKKAKEIIRKCLKNQNWNNSDIVGSKYREEKVNYHGIEQRWLIVKSDKREKSDLLKLETKVKKEKEKIEEKLARWAKVKRKNKQDLENEVKTVTEKLKYHQVLEINYREYQNKKQEVSYICEIKIQENKGSFINLNPRQSATHPGAQLC